MLRPSDIGLHPRHLVPSSKERGFGASDQYSLHVVFQTRGRGSLRVLHPLEYRQVLQQPQHSV